MAKPDEFVKTDAMRFIQTDDGRLGIGYCPDKDVGGFKVVKWCPDAMADRLAQRLLEKAARAVR